MTDQSQSGGDLSPSSAPASSPTSWAVDRKNEQASRHQPPPASRQSSEPSPNAARSNPPAGLLDEATRYRLNAESRRAAAREAEPGDHQRQQSEPGIPDRAAGDALTDEQINEALTRDAAERSRRLTLPQKPEDLPLELPKDWQTPQGIEFKLDPNNPLLPQAKAFALKHGLSVEGWKELLALSGASAVAAAHQRKTFVEGEIAKLGVNGTPRVTAITDFQKSYFGDEDIVKAMLPTTAKAVEGWERLIRDRQTQGAGNYPGGNREPPPSRADIPGYDGMSFAERRAAQTRFR